MSNITDPLKSLASTTAAATTPTATGVQALTTPATTSATTKPSTGLAQGTAALAGAVAPPSDSVAAKVQQLSSQDSPLMQQAKTDGLKTANRRGLLNSSMAVGAVQDATLRQILPIASQDASQEFQKNAQVADQVYQSGEKVLDRTQQNTLAAAERANQLAMQKTDITSREGLAAADRALQVDSQNREIAYQTAERKLDRGLQEQLASWNLKSADRGAAATMLNNMQAAFQDSYTAIMANTNLDATARENQIVSARNLRDKNLSLVEQMYNIDLTW